MNFYFSFGQKHFHKIKNVVFHAPVICRIQSVDESHARDKAFKAFGVQWAFSYSDATLNMKYFDKIIDLDTLTQVQFKAK